MQRCCSLCGSDIRSCIVEHCTSSDTVGLVRDKRGLEIAQSLITAANLLSQHQQIYESRTPGKLDDFFVTHFVIPTIRRRLAAVSGGGIAGGNSSMGV